MKKFLWLSVIEVNFNISVCKPDTQAVLHLFLFEKNSEYTLRTEAAVFVIDSIAAAVLGRNNAQQLI